MIFYHFVIVSGGGGGLVPKSCLILATPWTVDPQAPLSMGFSRKEYWSGLPFPSPGDLPDPGIEPRPPALRADTLTSVGFSWMPFIRLRSFPSIPSLLSVFFF